MIGPVSLNCLRRTFASSQGHDSSAATITATLLAFVLSFLLLLVMTSTPATNNLPVRPNSVARVHAMCCRCLAVYL